MKLVKRLKGVNKIDDELAKLERQMEELQKKKEALILKRAEEKGMPATWILSKQSRPSSLSSSSLPSLQPNADTDSRVLVEVPAMESEFWDVAEKLQTSLRDAHISKLWRVQNLSLWASYDLFKDNFMRNGIGANETVVFHGTGETDPGIVYNNQREGFSMNSVSKNCVWGRGIYFSEESVYCHNHDAYGLSETRPRSSSVVAGSFKPAGEDQRPSPTGAGEREMFLARLLVGSSVDMNQHESEWMKYRCSSLTSPPEDPITRSKYNTVTGRCDGSKIYVVYENGRAYPEYLIRYYRGSRDATRTPFKNRKEAMISSSTLSATTPKTSISNLSSDDGAGFAADLLPGEGRSVITPRQQPTTTPLATRWEFLDNTGWSAYSEAHQREIELFYQTYLTNPTRYRSTLVIQTNEWQYEVDVVGMKQRNLQHHVHRERNIRRVVL